jgi:rhamnose transport system permease protein
MNNLKARIRPSQLREFVLIFLILLMMFLFSTQIENYFSPRFFNRISTSVAIIAVVSIGQTLVVLTRNIDLSVGSIVGFTAYFVGQQLVQNNGLSPTAVVLMAIAIGALMGGINGVLVAYGGVPAIIVTLGTLAIFRTILVEVSNAKTVLTADLPEWLLDLPRNNLFSVGDLDFRLMVGVALLVVVVFGLMLQYTSYGRRLYAIGSHPEAAKIAGFPSRSIVFTAFILSGALAGLAGFMFLARFGNITVVAGLGIELESVAAVVVGGISTNGGTGTIPGALLGAILINILEQSLIRWLSISEFWRDFLLGFLILLAVAADSVIMSRLRDLWSRNNTHLANDHSAGEHVAIEGEDAHVS